MSDVTDILLAEIAENIKALVAVSPLSAGAILELLKTVDGSGSGLDADTVDGKQIVLFPQYNTYENTLFCSQNNNGGFWSTDRGDQYMLAGCWYDASFKYLSLDAAMVLQTYKTTGKIRVRYANLAGHAVGDTITWTVDTYLSTNLLSSSTVTSLATNVTTQGNNVIKKSDNGIVNLNLCLKGYQNYNAGITIATLPDGYKPTTAIVIPTMLEGSTNAIGVVISTDGTIKSFYGTLIETWVINICGTFI